MILHDLKIKFEYRSLDLLPWQSLTPNGLLKAHGVCVGSSRDALNVLA